MGLSDDGVLRVDDGLADGGDVVVTGQEGIVLVLVEVVADEETVFAAEGLIEASDVLVEGLREGDAVDDLAAGKGELGRYLVAKRTAAGS